MLVFAIFLLITTFSIVSSDTILCDGGITNDCQAQTISCAADELCTILCTLDYANATDYGVCRNAVINCKKGQNCRIECDAGLGACRRLTINGQNATTLDIISRNANSFISSYVYCPIAGHCLFKAEPVDIHKAFFGVNIYARNGFFDNAININCTRLDCLQNARINCTTDFSKSCLIDNNPLKQDICIGGGICGATLNPTSVPSMEPTLEPTFQPTNNPTQPTMNPTYNPTVNPTFYPTVQPTIFPTNIPTFYPTIQPTIYPTYIPTNHPITITNQPTIYPTINPSPIPTTQPSVEATIYPTNMSSIDNNPDDKCKGWNIIIKFLLTNYNQSDAYAYWMEKLEELFLNTFISTILSQFNMWHVTYCAIIDDVVFTLVSNQRRILSQNDIDVNITFMINNNLYSDCFITCNITQFGEVFKQIVLNELGNQVETIDKFMIKQPTSSIDSEVNNKQKSDGDNLGKLVILFIILGLFFVAIFIAISSIIIKIFGNKSIAKYPTADEINISTDMTRVSLPISQLQEVDQFHDTFKKAPSMATKNVAASIQAEMELTNIINNHK